MNTSKEGATVNRVSVGVMAVILAAVGLWPGTKEAWGQTGPVTVSDNHYEVLIDRGDGLGQQVLTGGWDPSLSLDQRRMAFVRYEGIFTIDVDGQGLCKVLDSQAFTQLVGSAGLPAFPAWTPDGRSLVFTWWNMVFDLAMVDLDGGNARLLTTSGMAGFVANRSWPSAFSPDGRRLLVNPPEAIGLSVRTMSDGSYVNLTGVSEAGSWSPDGLWVAYVRESRWMAESGNEETGLVVVSVDGATHRDLAASVRAVMAQAFEPVGLVTWSADGREVAVLNRADGLVYAVAVDGSGARQEVTHFVPYAYPASAVEGASWGIVKESTQP
jgi:Tol biopolymer transport system component